ncbi:MAG: penicillin-binding protein activator [Ignavibacteriae bacterium]|nr:penicillin-binding protein activator [Ignavibacteriota bacterium]
MYVARIALLVATLIGSCIRQVLSQESIEYSERAEELFQSGLSEFSKEKYSYALSFFDMILESHPLNHRTTSAYLMKAKSQLMLREYQDAERTLTLFLVRFPYSSFVPHAEYALGIAYLGERAYEPALQSFINAWRELPSPGVESGLQRQILASIEVTIDNYLSLTSIQRAIENSRSDGERMLLWLKLGEKASSLGNSILVSHALDTLTLRYTENPYSQRIASLRSRLVHKTSVKLGLLLPLMKRSDVASGKEVGQGVYEGISFAVEEYSRDPASRTKVLLEIRDTERDPLVASRATQELTDDGDIVGIIGPVFSNVASAAVGLANVRRVPLVTPTANANGIAAAGDYIFQANPDYETRGKAMARYGVLNLGYRRFAVLAPIDTYGKYMADAFIGEATHLGAKIVAVEWYQRGTSDLSMQIKNIRRAGLLETKEPLLSFAGKPSQKDLVKLVQLGVPMKTLDSLVDRRSIVNAAVLLGPDAKWKIDSVGISTVVTETQVDSLEYPVTGIQGVYAPIGSPEEIGVISSQLVYFNIMTQVLGSGEWNSFAELDANRRYCEGVVFESDYYVDSDDSAYVSFVIRFFDRYKKRPTKSTLYGYDVASLILTLIRKGVTTREGLRAELSNVREFPALHSRIGFSSRRVNSWVLILQYALNAIRRIDEVNVAQFVGRELHGESEKR